MRSGGSYIPLLAAFFYLNTTSGFWQREFAKKLHNDCTPREWRDKRASEFRINGEQFSQKKIPLFDELVDRYETIHLPTISLETRRRYLTDINRRIREYFRHRTLDSMVPMTIESFRADIMKDLEPKSVNNCTTLLAAIFRKGIEWGMLEKSPVRLRSLKIAEDKYI